MKKPIVILLTAILAVSAGMWLAQTSRYDIKTLHGDTYRYQDLQGKWVVVNYFAEWCAPCLREIPELNEFNEAVQAQSNAVLFGVSFDAKQNYELQILVDKYSIGFPIIADIKTALPFPQPKYLPATYLIRPDGTLAGQLLGEQSFEGLQEAISMPAHTSP